MDIRCAYVVLCVLQLHLTEGQQLVSVGKPINISSQLPGWSKQYAVDGKSGTNAACQCCAATLNGVTEYWYLLDLQQLYEIVRIDLLGRTDFNHYLDHMEISVGNTEDSLTSLVTTDSTTIREYSYTLSPVRSARYVKLTRHGDDHFVVCELSVYAACQDGTYGQGCLDPCGYCKNGASCDSVDGTCDECLNTHFMMPLCKVCADGWYGPNCNTQCGNCSGNDVCNKDNGNCPNNCDAGYQGGKCDQDCNVYSYGPGCLQRCGECNNDANCNHITGICVSCKTGFLNPMCQDCVDGRYGPECGSSCGQCAGTGKCDKGTGNCPSGCNAGYQGDKCDQDCNAGSYGPGCSHRCGECNNDANCNHITGICVSCKTGFLNPMCQDCVDGRYGPECGSSCGQCAGTGKCDKGTGNCPSGCNAGYQGIKCDQDCNAGSYGPGCSHRCGECNNDANCNHITGICVSCKTGFLNPMCQDCVDGRYGPECGSSCGQCAGTGKCDKGTGNCPSGCNAGYQGIKCDQDCNAGSYGPGCSHRCGECNNDANCNHITGICVSCKTGFLNPMCQDCVDGRYGPECGSSCGQCAGTGKCDKGTGNCPSGCNAGYQVDKCDQDCNAGSYGPGCSHRCGECNNDANCNHITGICVSCKTGFLNPMCQDCVDGRYGPECGSSCGQCAGTGKCDKGTGNCPSGCNAGYQGIKCDQDCNAGSYGPGCSHRCGECNNDANCNHITGICVSCKTGFLNPMCQDCVDGRYGPECGSSCGHCAGTGTCDKGTGNCPSGCNAGYQGDKCDQDCWHMRFGPNCNKSCGNCLDSDVCSTTDGACPNLCAAGYMGDTCHSSCSIGQYGKNCVQKCGNCKNTTSCMPDSGVCEHGCAEGFNPPHCAACSIGQYGKNCVQKCGNCQNTTSCMPDSGVCELGCAEGFNPPYCAELTHEPSPPVPVGVIAGGIGAAVVVAIVIVAVVIVLKRRQKKNGYSSSKDSFKDIPTNDITVESTVKKPKPARKPMVEVKMETNTSTMANNGNVNDLDKHNPGDIENPYDEFLSKKSELKICQLWDYIRFKKKQQSIMFYQEYSYLPDGMCKHSYEIAMKLENRGKNRYRGLYAYDHTRVPLEIEDEGEVDYINASFIDGYDTPRKFIASQGPTEKMRVDFWRMVWQHQTKNIVMLTNLVEKGNDKCILYWPTTDEKTVKYGNIEITLLSEEFAQDYVIRHMEITKVGESGKLPVTHYHYMAWPDKSYPDSTWSLVKFWRLVEDQTSKVTEHGPIVVHCSAGIGRTGTFIALDNAYYKTKTEGTVQILEVVKLLRDQRVSMVQTKDQYVYLHEAVADALLFGTHFIWTSQYEEVYEYLLKKEKGSSITRLQKQYKIIVDSIADKKKSLHATTVVDTDDVYTNIILDKTRTQMSADEYRPKSKRSVYVQEVGAFIVQNHEGKDVFTICKSPSESGLRDFWFLIKEQNVKTIVSLPEMSSNKRTSHLGLENKTIQDTFGLSLVEERKTSAFTERKIKLKDSMDDITVHQFEYNGWASGDSVPKDASSMVHFVEAILDCQRRLDATEPVLIYCNTGCQRSGVLCVLLAEFYRMIRDGGHVNIIETVKLMKERNEEIVGNYDQYLFIHDVIRSRVQDQTYQNQ